MTRNEEKKLLIQHLEKVYYAGACNSLKALFEQAIEWAEKHPVKDYEVKEAEEILSRASMYDLKLEQLERAQHDLATREGGQDYRHNKLAEKVDQLEAMLYRWRAEMKAEPTDPTEETLNQTF